MTPEKRDTAINWLKEEIRSLRRAPEINGCGPENWADLLEIMETCLEAVKNHFPDLTKMVPLTLGQLWEIDGHPVWSKKHKEWFLLCKRPSRYMMYDRNGFCLPVRDAIEYGLYSYPLDHIDQEAWTAKWEVDEFGHKCSKCGEYLPSGDDDIFPQFCPNCGRATTADALEELEKRLRG